MFFSAYTKRLYKFILKRLIGKFLEGELNFDQLEVRLKSGQVELTDLTLNVVALNEAFGLVDSPFCITHGFIGKVQMYIAYHDLQNESCTVEISDVRIEVRPAAKGRASLIDSAAAQNNETASISGMSMATYQTQQPRDPAEEQAAAVSNEDVEEPSKAKEGLDYLAQWIDSITSKVQVTIRNVVIVVLPAEIEDMDAPCFALHLDELHYQNAETTRSPNDASPMAPTGPHLQRKTIKLGGLRLWLSTVGKAEAVKSSLIPSVSGDEGNQGSAANDDDSEGAESELEDLESSTGSEYAGRVVLQSSTHKKSHVSLIFASKKLRSPSVPAVEVDAVIDSLQLRIEPTMFAGILRLADSYTSQPQVEPFPMSASQDGKLGNLSRSQLLDDSFHEEVTDDPLMSSLTARDVQRFKGLLPWYDDEDDTSDDEFFDSDEEELASQVDLYGNVDISSFDMEGMSKVVQDIGLHAHNDDTESVSSGQFFDAEDGTGVVHGTASSSLSQESPNSPAVKQVETPEAATKQHKQPVSSTTTTPSHITKLRYHVRFQLARCQIEVCYNDELDSSNDLLEPLWLTDSKQHTNLFDAIDPLSQAGKVQEKLIVRFTNLVLDAVRSSGSSQGNVAMQRFGVAELVDSNPAQNPLIKSTPKPVVVVVVLLSGEKLEDPNEVALLAYTNKCFRCTLKMSTLRRRYSVSSSLNSASGTGFANNSATIRIPGLFLSVDLSTVVRLRRYFESIEASCPNSLETKVSHEWEYPMDAGFTHGRLSPVEEQPPSDEKRRMSSHRLSHATMSNGNQKSSWKVQATIVQTRVLLRIPTILDVPKNSTELAAFEAANGSKFYQHAADHFGWRNRCIVFDLKQVKSETNPGGIEAEKVNGHGASGSDKNENTEKLLGECTMSFVRMYLVEQWWGSDPELVAKFQQSEDVSSTSRKDKSHNAGAVSMILDPGSEWYTLDTADPHSAIQNEIFETSKLIWSPIAGCEAKLSAGQAPGDTLGSVLSPTIQIHSRQKFKTTQQTAEAADAAESLAKAARKDFEYRIYQGSNQARNMNQDVSDEDVMDDLEQEFEDEPVHVTAEKRRARGLATAELTVKLMLPSLALDVARDEYQILAHLLSMTATCASSIPAIMEYLKLIEGSTLRQSSSLKQNSSGSPIVHRPGSSMEKNNPSSSVKHEHPGSSVKHEHPGSSVEQNHPGSSTEQNDPNPIPDCDVNDTFINDAESDVWAEDGDNDTSSILEPEESSNFGTLDNIETVEDQTQFALVVESRQGIVVLRENSPSSIASNPGSSNVFELEYEGLEVIVVDSGTVLEVLDMSLAEFRKSPWGDGSDEPKRVVALHSTKWGRGENSPPVLQVVLEKPTCTGGVRNSDVRVAMHNTSLRYELHSDWLPRIAAFVSLDLFDSVFVSQSELTIPRAVNALYLQEPEGLTVFTRVAVQFFTSVVSFAPSHAVFTIPKNVTDRINAVAITPSTGILLTLDSFRISCNLVSPSESQGYRFTFRDVNLFLTDDAPEFDTLHERCFRDMKTAQASDMEARYEQDDRTPQTVLQYAEDLMYAKIISLSKAEVFARFTTIPDESEYSSSFATPVEIEVSVPNISVYSCRDSTATLLQFVEWWTSAISVSNTEDTSALKVKHDTRTVDTHPRGKAVQRSKRFPMSVLEGINEYEFTSDVGNQHLAKHIEHSQSPLDSDAEDLAVFDELNVSATRMPSNSHGGFSTSMSFESKRKSVHPSTDQPIIANDQLSASELRQKFNEAHSAIGGASPDDQLPASVLRRRYEEQVEAPFVIENFYSMSNRTNQSGTRTTTDETSLSASRMEAADLTLSQHDLRNLHGLSSDSSSDSLISGHSNSDLSVDEASALQSATLHMDAASGVVNSQDKSMQDSQESELGGSQNYSVQGSQENGNMLRSLYAWSGTVQDPKPIEMQQFGESDVAGLESDTDVFNDTQSEMNYSLANSINTVDEEIEVELVDPGMLSEGGGSAEMMERDIGVGTLESLARMNAQLQLDQDTAERDILDAENDNMAELVGVAQVESKLAAMSKSWHMGHMNASIQDLKSQGHQWHPGMSLMIGGQITNLRQHDEEDSFGSLESDDESSPSLAMMESALSWSNRHDEDLNEMNLSRLTTNNANQDANEILRNETKLEHSQLDTETMLLKVPGVQRKVEESDMMSKNSLEMNPGPDNDLFRSSAQGVTDLNIQEGDTITQDETSPGQNYSIVQDSYSTRKLHSHGEDASKGHEDPHSTTSILDNSNQFEQAHGEVESQLHDSDNNNMSNIKMHGEAQGEWLSDGKIKVFPHHVGVPYLAGPGSHIPPPCITAARLLGGKSDMGPDVHVGPAQRRVNSRFILRECSIQWRMFDGRDWSYHEHQVERTSADVTGTEHPPTGERASADAAAHHPTGERASADAAAHHPTGERKATGWFSSKSSYNVAQSESRQRRTRLLQSLIDDDFTAPNESGSGLNEGITEDHFAMSSNSEKVPLSHDRAALEVRVGGPKPKRVRRQQRGTGRKLENSVLIVVNKLSCCTESLEPSLVDHHQHEISEHDQIIWKMAVSVKDFEVCDCLSTSDINKLVCYWEDSTKHPRETNAAMLRLALDTYLVGPSREEHQVRLAILPLRVNLDQDTMEFISQFLQYVADAKPTPSSGAATPTSNPVVPSGSQSKINDGIFVLDSDEVPAALAGQFGDNEEEEDQPHGVHDQTAMFFQSFDVRGWRVKIDYWPKRFDYAGVKQGRLVELVNLFGYEGLEVALHRVRGSGANGFGDLGERVVASWIEDITRKQLHKCLAGVSAPPFNTIAAVGSGMANLVLLPVDQYKKDGNVLKGIRKGASAFARTVAVEALTTASKIAITTQNLLEHADDILKAPAERQSSDSTLSNRISTSSAVQSSTVQSATRRNSHRWTTSQPSSLSEGFEKAKDSMSRGVKGAMHTIVAVPIREYSRNGATGAVKSVIRAVPVAILKPVIGATEAVSHTLLGARNNLDPKVQQDLGNKYKR